MQDLALDEQFTLEMVAHGGDDVVVDGNSLVRLESRGLVTLRDDGWEVTPLGQFAIRQTED